MHTLEKRKKIQINKLKCSPQKSIEIKSKINPKQSEEIKQ
jgi:hypothetical protein